MEVRSIRVADLRLDPKNPRLPENLRDASEAEIVSFLRRSEALDELAISFQENGYFESDPVIVVAEDGGVVNVVVEGNRRVATLKLILGLVDGEEDFDDVPFSRERLSELAEIPCFVASARSDVDRFIGFRHIGGLKLWPPEAKARYVADAVDAAVSSGEPEPFREVGRQVGSNAQGVRTLYIAISILRYARSEFGLDVSELQANKFGVWLRALSSPELREYIGLESPRTYQEVQTSLHSLEQGRLREVLRDLIPQGVERKALVSDSRLITDYGRILVNERAREILRSTGNMEAARQLVENLSLPERVSRLLGVAAAVFDDASRQDLSGISAVAVSTAGELSNITKNLHSLLRAAQSID